MNIKGKDDEGTFNQATHEYYDGIWSISFISFLYSVYFVSKEIKTIELNRNCSIRECILEIVLILAFPIGIWIIQPRITKIYKEHLAVQ